MYTSCFTTKSRNEIAFYVAKFVGVKFMFVLTKPTEVDTKYQNFCLL